MVGIINPVSWPDDLRFLVVQKITNKLLRRANIKETKVGTFLEIMNLNSVHLILESQTSEPFANCKAKYGSCLNAAAMKI